MSDNIKKPINTSENSTTSSKSRKYIIIFSTIAIVIAIAIYAVPHLNNKNSGNPSVANSSTQGAAEFIPDATQGSADATIEADISFREIDFSLSKDDIIEKEKNLEDTLDNPSIAESADGYTYLTFESNPDKPLGYNNITVANQGNPCLTYVLNNGNLEEVRLQFGSLDSSSLDGLIANLKSQYGENTFYRSTNGTETYWWKTSDKWLMLTKDTSGTTIFYRRN